MCNLKQPVLCDVLPCDINLLYFKQPSMSCGQETEGMKKGDAGNVIGAHSVWNYGLVPIVFPHCV